MHHLRTCLPMTMRLKWHGWSRSYSKTGFQNVFFGHGLFSNVTTFFRKVQEGCNEGPLQDHEKDPMDVVMLCKEWVHSATLSQQPLAILPKTYLPALDRVRVGTSERKVLSKKECEELLVNVLKSGVETDLKK